MIQSIEVTGVDGTLQVPVDKVTPSRRPGAPTRRNLPALAALALAAFAVGGIVGSIADSGSEQTASEFAAAWQRGDLAAMHALLTPAARERYPRRAFDAAYSGAAATATATGRRVRAGAPSDERDGRQVVPVAVRTRLFGVVREDVELPISDEAVNWAPHLAFPGVAVDERLERRTQAPRRARILSADGKVLAQGPPGARTSPAGEVGSSIAGQMGESEDLQERAVLFARGFSTDTPVGISGLERALQRRLEGRPGGTLQAGGRVLARAKARAAKPVRSTIDTRLQGSAVTALAGRLGGIAVIDTRTGAIRALAGIAFSAPQPPGSTFKIVTTVAALEAGLVKPGDKFPVETRALIDGVEVENANGESCGGTFAQSFAHSCNSVFAPLGVKLGSKRLVAAAERFGWNEKPTLAGARASTLPKPKGIVSPLEVGASAIGQFKVLATPLQLASVAQTIAAKGVRLEPRLTTGEPPRRERVTSRAVASTVAELMVGVVGFGTGTAAAIPGVKVAGKTGTAELEDTRGPEADGETVSDPMNTDAWFTAFAPADRPQIAVAVLLVRNGSGGATAAPAARTVLATALGKG